MLLHLSPWPMVEKWLEKSDTIVIPIGSMEQHGPNGFIGTDALCPEIIAHLAESKAPNDICVGPTFNVGCAQHHLAFPGTITMRPSTMMAVMQDWTASLVRHGFRRIYWFNGHGGNVATIEAAFSEIHAQRSFSLKGEDMPELHLKRVNWWDFKAVETMCFEMYPTGHGMHATASEVSVTYFGYPDHIPDQPEMTPKIAPMGGISDALQYARDFPDGRIGSDPTQSNKEDGAKLAHLSADELLKSVRAFSS